MIRLFIIPNLGWFMQNWFLSDSFSKAEPVKYQYTKVQYSPIKTPIQPLYSPLLIGPVTISYAKFMTGKISIYKHGRPEVRRRLMI